MPTTTATKKKPKPKPKPKKTPARSAGGGDVESALRALERKGTARTRDGYGRYGIVVGNDKAFGVTVAEIRALGKQLGSDHALALQLWDSGWYEARMLAAFVAEPERVTPVLMDRWCRDFDNWALCDTLCFHLFDRTPHAFAKVHAWAKRNPEYEKRAAFALLATLALHGRGTDAELQRCLPLIERAAGDGRNFVKKAVSWALRGVGERSPQLNQAALKLARKLAASAEPTPRWIGKDALRALESPTILRRLEKRTAKKKKS